jgi:hypothetical protein
MADNTIVVDNPRRRVGAVQQLVSPLRPLAKGHSVAAPVQSLFVREDQREIVVAVSEIKRGRDDYRAWFFKTAADGVLGQYFEAWAMGADESQWRLSQACLHLFRAAGPREDPSEVLALHCEPKETAENFMARLKRGPHVHLKQADGPLGKAHFPLNLCHLDEVLQSWATLAKALTTAIQVARSEVLLAEW